VANTIGVGTLGGLTPVTISGGAIIADNINATGFGAASMLSNITVTEALVRSFAAGHATTNVIRTVEREVVRRDTVTIPVRVADSIVYRHDTFRLAIEIPEGTAVIYDTIEAWEPVHDTIYVGEFTHDTLRLGHDTLWQTVVQHDTIWRDTVEVEHVTTLEGLIRVRPNLPTGAEGADAGNALVVTRHGNLVYFTGLDPQADFAIFTPSGKLVYRGRQQPVAVDAGVFIVGQSGRWWRFVK